MKLLLSQKNELFDLIEGSGFSASQFELKETRSNLSDKVATLLTFKKSDYYFNFESSNKNVYSFFCPGSESYKEEKSAANWTGQLYYFQGWLVNLRREVSTINKWDRLDSEIAELKINFQSEEGKFSFKEHEDLQQRMQVLKGKIETIGLAAEQVSALNSKLDHLTDLAKDMSKFDWKGLFIGTLISMVIQLSVTPDNAKSLWGVIRQVFGNYYLLP